MPLDLVNEYVKRGNLNNRAIEKLPDVDFRIELYEITRRKPGVYRLQINNVMEAQMEGEFNYKEDNNVRPVRLLEGVWTVSEHQHAHVYGIINKCFNAYAKMDTEKIIIKTFSKVEQKKYRCGQPINLHLNRMTQEVILESRQEVATLQKLEHLMPGFPIPEGLLRGLDKALEIAVAAQ